MGKSLKEKTASGLLWGGIGNGMMQVASFVFGIFLSRLLSPEDYGMVGVLAIFTAIAGMFVEAGFITAIVNKKEVTHNDYNAVFWFSLLMGMGIYVILFLCAPLIARFYDKPELTALSRYLFLSIIFSCLGISAHAHYMRNMKVKERSIIQIVAIFSAGIVGVVLAWLGFGYWGIASQTLVYILLSTIGVWILCPWKPSLKIDFTPLKDMFSFSSKLFVTTFFIHINNNVFSMLLGRLFSIKQAGYYSQANKWTVMGYSIISGMLNSVVQPVLRESRDDRERLLKVFRKMLRFTAFVSFPLMFGLGAVAEEFIVITITDKWMDSVALIKILCVWGAFYPVQVLFTGLFNSLSKPQIFMWNTMAMGILQIVCLVLAYPYGINIMVISFVVLNLLNILFFRLYACKYIGFTFIDFMLDMLPFLLATLLSVGVAVYIADAISNIYISLLAKIVVAVAIYISIMYVTRSVIFREVVSFLFKHQLK